MILTQASAASLFAANPSWWAVGLLPEHAEWIRNAANRRNENGKAKGWVSKTSDTMDDWHLSGVASEWAVSRIYNVPINGIEIEGDQTRMADLGDFIECKSSRSNDSNRWAVKENEYKLKDNRVYVNCVTCLFPEWIVCIGWAWGHELRQGTQQTHGAAGHKFRLIDWEGLREPKSLFDVLREREKR